MHFLERRHSLIPSRITDYYAENSLKHNLKKLLKQIVQHADSLEFDALAVSLKKLCGSLGHAEIYNYNGDLQIHLYFASESDRSAVMLFLPIQRKLCKSCDQLDKWQIAQENGLFTLKLSAYQSIALLGRDPMWGDSFEEAENILRKTKELVSEKQLSKTNNFKNNFPLMDLKVDIIKQICLFLPIKDLGSFSQTHKIVCQLLDDRQLWTFVASIQNIQLNAKDMHPRDYIKNSGERMIKIVSNLVGKKFAEANGSKMFFVGLTKSQIEEVGGFCLTANRNRNADGPTAPYKGIVINQEKGNYLLHLCPGHRGCSFSLREFETHMPIAITNLIELGITPDFLSLNVIFQLGNAYNNFLKWQQRHRKI